MHYCPMSWFSLSSFLKSPPGYLSAGRSYFKSRVMWMMTGNVSKRNQLSPEWGVKANPNKQCWLVSGRYCPVCLHHRHQIVDRICLPNPGAKTSPVILHESQSHYQRKLNLSAKALMRWQMRSLCSLQAAQTLMELRVLGAAMEQFLEGFQWPWKWLNCDSYCISVTFSSHTQQHPVLWVAWSKLSSD